MGASKTLSLEDDMYTFKKVPKLRLTAGPHCVHFKVKTEQQNACNWAALLKLERKNIQDSTSK